MARVLTVAALAYVLCVIGALSSSHTTNTTTPTPNAGHVATAHARAALNTPLRGFAISLHHTDHFPLYLQAIDQMAKMGFDSVEVLTPAFQTDGASTDLRIEPGPGRGADLDQLVTLLRYARSRGMTTALMPVVLFTHPRDNEWRGKIHPEQWQPWWRNYTKIIDRFVDVANRADVNIFSVGSELLSTEKQQHRWLPLIERVRARFDGLLTYSTNWDHYHVTTMWDHLDLIGISGYWDITTLTDPDAPDPQQLTERWLQIRKKVLAFARERGKPVLFTEVGYPSLPWGLKDPWNYINPDNLPSDGRTQSLGYAAFLSAWDDLLQRPTDNRSAKALMGGVFFYEWDPYRAGDINDTGYGVRGKPAEKVIRSWLHRIP